MSQGITFDNYSFQSDTVITSRVSHETLAPRELSYLKIASERGVSLIDDTYGPKNITLEGTIISPTASGLDGKVREMGEVLSRRQRNLDIDYEGGTVRYGATPVEFSIEREYYHISSAPYRATFFVPEGIGRATASISGTKSGIATDGQTFDISISGSAPPKPVITVGVEASSTINQISLYNITTSKRILVNRTNYAAGDILEIATGDKTVKLNNMPVTYSGVFPEFEMGTNTLQFILQGTTESIDEKQENTAHITYLGTGQWVAQSFKLDGNGTVKKVSLFLRKIGTPPFSTVNLEIQTDSNNAPSGTVVSNATKTVSVNNIPSAVENYVPFIFSTPPSLSLATTYWLVVKASSDSGNTNNRIVIRFEAGGSDRYANGELKYTINQGKTWNAANYFEGSQYYDLVFRIYTGAGTSTFNLRSTLEYAPNYR